MAQLRASLEDYQKHYNESESRYKCEIAKLKNKNQEIQFTLEELQKDRGHKGVAMGSQASCNGDFLSEAGSLVTFLFCILRTVESHYLERTGNWGKKTPTY